MTDFDPLDDIFGSSKPANSEPSGSKGAKTNFDDWNPSFDASFDPGGPAHDAADEDVEPHQDLPLVGGSSSHNYRPVTSSGSWGSHSMGVEKVDQEELRRRIKGGSAGSENTGVVPRVQQALADGCRFLRFCGKKDPNLMTPPGVCGAASGLVEDGCGRVHERYSSAPRTFMLAVLVICVAAGGSVSYYRSGSVLPFEVTIFDKRGQAAANAEDESGQTSTGDSKSSETGDETSKDAEDSREANKDSEDSSDAKGDGAAPRSGAGAKQPAGSREFAALRRAVTDGDRAIQEELKSLRQEVARLVRQQRKNSPDAAAGGTSEATAEDVGAKRDTDEDAAESAGDAEEDVSDKLPRGRSRFGSVRKEARGSSNSPKIGKPKMSQRKSSDAASDPPPAPAYKRGNRNPSDAVYR